MGAPQPGVSRGAWWDGQARQDAFTRTRQRRALPRPLSPNAPEVPGGHPVGSVSPPTSLPSTAQSTARHGTAQQRAQHGTEEHGTRHSTAQNGTEWHSMAWRGTAQHGMAQYGMAQHGKTQGTAVGLSSYCGWAGPGGAAGGSRAWGREGQGPPSGSPPCSLPPSGQHGPDPGRAGRMQDRPRLRIELGWEREEEEGWGFLCDGSSSSRPAAAMRHGAAQPSPCARSGPRRGPRHCRSVGWGGDHCSRACSQPWGLPHRLLPAQHPLPAAGQSQPSWWLLQRPKWGWSHPTTAAGSWGWAGTRRQQEPGVPRPRGHGQRADSRGEG